MEIWNSSNTMNLTNRVARNIWDCQYYIDLLEVTTWDEVVAMIRNEVEWIEPWDPTSKEPSKALCLLYKLFKLKVTERQMNNMLYKEENPWVRALAVLYLRLTCPPEKLWKWLEPLVDDDQEFRVCFKGDVYQSIGSLVRQCIQRQKFFDIVLPRIPVRLQRSLLDDLKQHDRDVRGGGNGSSGGGDAGGGHGGGPARKKGRRGGAGRLRREDDDFFDDVRRRKPHRPDAADSAAGSTRLVESGSDRYVDVDEGRRHHDRYDGGRRHDRRDDVDDRRRRDSYEDRGRDRYADRYADVDEGRRHHDRYDGGRRHDRRDDVDDRRRRDDDYGRRGGVPENIWEERHRSGRKRSLASRSPEDEPARKRRRTSAAEEEEETALPQDRHGSPRSSGPGEDGLGGGGPAHGSRKKQADQMAAKLAKLHAMYGPTPSSPSSGASASTTPASSVMDPPLDESGVRRDPNDVLGTETFRLG